MKKEIKLRKLAPLSVLKFGKYEGKTLEQVIALGGIGYLIWIYYHFEKISFIDDVFDNKIPIPEKFRIEKPGKNPKLFEQKRFEIRRAVYSTLDVNKGHSKAYRINRTERARADKKYKKKVTSKYTDTLRNHGHSTKTEKL